MSRSPRVRDGVGGNQTLETPPKAGSQTGLASRIPKQCLLPSVGIPKATRSSCALDPPQAPGFAKAGPEGHHCPGIQKRCGGGTPVGPRSWRAVGHRLRACPNLRGLVLGPRRGRAPALEDARGTQAKRRAREPRGARPAVIASKVQAETRTREGAAIAQASPLRFGSDR